MNILFEVFSFETGSSQYICLDADGEWFLCTPVSESNIVYSQGFKELNDLLDHFEILNVEIQSQN
jgi:hypothetical protein